MEGVENPSLDLDYWISTSNDKTLSFTPLPIYIHDQGLLHADISSTVVFEKILGFLNSGTVNYGKKKIGELFLLNFE